MKSKLPDEWKEYRIREIGTVVTGNTPPKKYPENYGGSLPWIKPPDLDKEMYVSNSEETISDIGMKKVRLLTQGSVLVSCIGNIGKVAIADSELCTNQQINAIVPNKKIVNTLFLYYSIKRIRPYLESIASSAVVPLLNKTDFSNVKIELPPLETQHKIAAILEKAEETKKLRAQADELTQHLLQSVFLEMFGDPVKNPKDFNSVKLGDIGDVSSGLTLNSKRRNNKDNLFPYLRVANVFRNKLNLNEIKLIHASDVEIDKIMLKNNDILIVEGHGNIKEIGRSAVWKGEIPNCIHQNHIIKVRLNEKYMQSFFLSYFLNIYGNNGYFPSKSRTTSGLNTISTNKVRNAKVILPPIELQQKFGQIVTKFNQIRELQKHSMQNIDKLFDALMQKAFNGELVS